MKVKVQGKEIKVGFDAYMALKNENSDLKVVSYSNDLSLEDRYGDKTLECHKFCAKIKIMLEYLPSPDTATYTDLESIVAIREHLDMVHDMLTSWTGFQDND
jgi:hypothetical protein